MESSTEDLSCQKGVNGVRESLDEEGYAIMNFSELGEVIKFIGNFGAVFNIEDIKVDKERRGRLASEKSMGFHTDHPLAKYICWYCVSQSDMGGESFLVDSREVLSTIGNRELLKLEDVEVVSPRVGKIPHMNVSLLSEEGIYFADWLISKRSKERLSSEISIFKSKLFYAKTVSIRLQENQALFIDNKRILHGRSEIKEVQKKRHLVRFWITDKVTQSYDPNGNVS